MMRKINTLIFTLLFLGAMFGGLFHMTMGMEMTGCPFISHDVSHDVTHKESLCSMSILDHIESWRASFLAVVSSLTLLLLALVAVAVILAFAPNLVLRQKFKEPLLPKELLHSTHLYTYRLLQELFSSGILHPKLF